MKQKKIFRFTIYILGFVVLALGIICNTKSGLGVTPIISIPYSISLIIDFNFGNASMIMYTVLAIIEYIVKGRNFKLYDLLQIPLSFFLTRLFNLFSSFLPDAHTIPMRILCLIIGIVCTGIGAAMSMNARLVPNPGDGIVQAISDRSKKNPGLVKNIFDIGCVTITILIGILSTGHIIGVNVGTLCAMIGVGRVIAIYDRFLLAKTDRLSGISEDDDDDMSDEAAEPAE
ncbi:MAG: YitT family protein [Candidatus Weimeria sp.]